LLSDLLSKLSNLSEPIAVGIIGAGMMGRGLYHQTAITPGITCVALADIKLDRAISCVKAAGHRFEIAETPEKAAIAIGQQAVCVCSDAELIVGAPNVDVVVDASTAIAASGRFAERAILNHKHIILMNAEIDLIFGPYLASLAEREGVVYTSCDGDQHGVIKRLWDEATLWGMKPFFAGNIKGFLDRYATPTTIVPEADKRHLDYHMATAFTDGTKLCVEMALVANALGLHTTIPGMRGPQATHVKEALTLFDLEACSTNGGVVDYVLGGEPGGGVFVIGRCDDASQKRMLAYYKMGKGPFYLFYRPYHLCHIEATRSIADACLEGVSLLKPDFGFQTNVYAYAKRDLREGERLDGIGGYTCYGMIENASGPALNTGLPICLADGARLKRDMSKDEKITLDNVECNQSGDAWRLYDLAMQHSGADAG